MNEYEYNDVIINICEYKYIKGILNSIPKTNLFPKYHMSKHYRTCVKWDTKKNNKKVRNKLLN